VSLSVKRPFPENIGLSSHQKNPLFYGAWYAVMAIVKVPKSSFSWIPSAFKAVDLRDFFVFGGLSMLGYGLYQLYPWLGWTVSGTILMSFGLFVGKRGA
jgi:hypothetical protein